MTATHEVGLSSRPPSPRVDTRPRAHQIAAVVTGNALEFYDFLSFSFFSVNLARVMFPAGAPGTALLLTVMTGSLGFFARPVGAVVFGWLGDRVGRRPTMLTTFGLMGVGALGLALTPSYAAIGLVAPVMVVGFRLLQGLAAGGDVGPSTAYLAESAPPGRRGLIVSLQLAAMRGGAMLSGVVGLLLASMLSPAALDSFGWRVAFGIGAAIVPFAFLLRRRLDETLFQPEVDPPSNEAMKPWIYVAAVACVFGGLVTAGIADFLFTFTIAWLKAPPRAAYALTIAMGAVNVVCILISGRLIDRIGRRWMKLLPWGLGALLTLPLFAWAAETRDFGRLAVAGLVLTALTSLGVPAAYAAFVETTPKRWRSGLVGTGYGLVVAAAFGLGPPLVTDWLHRTGDLRAPGYVWFAGYLIGLAAAAITPETLARRPVSEGRTAQPS